jgi:hypothetical protein
VQAFGEANLIKTRAVSKKYLNINFYIILVVRDFQTGGAMMNYDRNKNGNLLNSIS